MFEDIENIKLVFSSRNKRKTHIKSERKNHILIFRTSGCGVHFFENTFVESPTGTILFIPGGSSYSFVPSEDEPCCSVSVTFSADITNPSVKIFKPENFSALEKCANEIYKHLRMRTPASRHIAHSLLFSVLAQLVTLENLSYCDKRKLKLIGPALDYINKNLLNPELRTVELHNLCGISPAYFRRIFKANLCSTPQKYIEDKRLEHALSLIEENEYSISEISRMSGYDDPLYFSKVFKSKYGVAPSYADQLML